MAVFRLKEGANLNKFAELGYVITDDGGEIYTIVKQPVDGETANYLFKHYYKNPVWKDTIYKKHEDVFEQVLGLKYDENGELIISDKLQEVLTDWILFVDLTEVNEQITLAFRNKDPFDSHVFVGSGLIRKYCEEEIQKLLDNDLIEEYEELPIA